MSMSTNQLIDFGPDLLTRLFEMLSIFLGERHDALITVIWFNSLTSVLDGIASRMNRSPGDRKSMIAQTISLEVTGLSNKP